MTTCPPSTSTDVLQSAFLTLLPCLERHGRVAFRHLRCPHARQEAVQEMQALAWNWFVRLARRGKDAARFPATFAVFAARAVRCGRRLCGAERAGDVLSPRARRRHGFAVVPLTDGGTLPGVLLDDALSDNTQTPVPDQVIFRHDFPAWLGTRTERDRRLVGALMAGERTQDVADQHGLYPRRSRTDFDESTRSMASVIVVIW